MSQAAGRNKCAQCSAEGQRDAGFCTECGAKLVPYVPPQANANTCAECGAADQKSTGFCTECGSYLRAKVADNAIQTPPPKVEQKAPPLQSHSTRVRYVAPLDKKTIIKEADVALINGKLPVQQIAHDFKIKQVIWVDLEEPLEPGPDGLSSMMFNGVKLVVITEGQYKPT